MALWRKNMELSNAEKKLLDERMKNDIVQHHGGFYVENKGRVAIPLIENAEIRRAAGVSVRKD